MIDRPNPLVLSILSDIEDTSRALVESADESADDHEPAGLSSAWMYLERLRTHLTRLEAALAEPPS